MKSLQPTGRTLCMAACACLLATGQHAIGADCPTGFSGGETSPGVKEGTLIHETREGECIKADIHIDSNQKEFRARETTINSDSSDNPAGKTHALEVKKGVMVQEIKEPYAQKKTYSQLGMGGDEWPVNDVTREFTTRIPKPPPWPRFSFGVEDGMLNVLFLKKDADESCIDKTKNYVEKLKSRGFTINPYTHEQKEHFRSFVYKAKDSAGYSVHIASCTFLSLHDPESTRRDEEYEKERKRMDEQEKKERRKRERR